MRGGRWSAGSGGIGRGVFIVTALAIMVPNFRAWAGEAKPDPLALGYEIFNREWQPDDTRSHDGDGLGPVYNDTSCVACHNSGGSGGAGPVSKNIDILSACGISSIRPRCRRHRPNRPAPSPRSTPDSARAGMSSCTSSAPTRITTSGDGRHSTPKSGRSWGFLLRLRKSCIPYSYHRLVVVGGCEAASDVRNAGRSCLRVEGGSPGRRTEKQPRPARQYDQRRRVLGLAIAAEPDAAVRPRPDRFHPRRRHQGDGASGSRRESGHPGPGQPPEG